MISRKIFYKYMAYKQHKNEIRILRSDGELRMELQGQFLIRDGYYTAILENYASITTWRNRFKEFHKWFFFWLIVVSGIFGIVLMYRVFKIILDTNNIEKIIEATPVLLTAMVSFVSTIIVVPKTITEFLFNIKEDTGITEIIKHTQEHDASGRNMIYDGLNKQSYDDIPTSDDLPEESISFVDSDVGA